MQAPLQHEIRILVKELEVKKTELNQKQSQLEQKQQELAIREQNQFILKTLESYYQHPPNQNKWVVLPCKFLEHMDDDFKKTWHMEPARYLVSNEEEEKDFKIPSWIGVFPLVILCGLAYGMLDGVQNWPRRYYYHHRCCASLEVSWDVWFHFRKQYPNVTFQAWEWIPVMMICPKIQNNIDEPLSPDLDVSLPDSKGLVGALCWLPIFVTFLIVWFGFPNLPTAVHTTFLVLMIVTSSFCGISTLVFFIQELRFCCAKC
jgi:hypothetical protein